MATIRIVKNNNYSVVHNGFINNSELSFKAKGILLYFLSKPDNWNFYVKEIAKDSTDGVESIRSGIKELEDHGYVHKNLKRDSSGKLSGGYDFTVYEIAQPKCDSTETVKNQNGILPNRENHSLLNTELILNTNNKKEKGKTEFDEVINSYTENQDLKNAIYEFIKYRKSIKATLTTLALKKNLNKLNNISSSDKEKIAILENSIMNGWKGLFPLSEAERPKANIKAAEPHENKNIEIDKSKLGGI